MAIDWPPAVVYPILAAGGIALAGLLLRGIRWTIAQITEDVVDTLDGRLGLNNLRAAVATIQRELRPNTGESMKDQATAADIRDTQSTAATPKKPMGAITEDSSIVDLVRSLAARIDHLDETINRAGPD